MTVDVFHIECTAEALPPSKDWIVQQISMQLPKASQILQWAIVDCDSKTHCLHIEGAYLTS